MENILTGNSIFQLTGTHEALFIKFGHRMLDSFAFLSGIRKIFMT